MTLLCVFHATLSKESLSIKFTAQLSKMLPVKTIRNINLNIGCLETRLDVNLKAHCKIMAVKSSTLVTILMATNLQLIATNKRFG